MPKEYIIGRHQLLLPDDHQLDQYQARWHRYDTALGYIAQVIFQKYPQASAIDIGANVGDSSALIQTYQDVPILCIEGNPEFLEFLYHNASIVGNLEIEESFIGADGEIVNFDYMQSQNGTASIVNAIDSDGLFLTELKSLDRVLQEHPSFQTAKLLKIDTDGFDFSIIQKSISVLSSLQPVIYFEYDISFTPDAREESLKALKSLLECGYKNFIVYDNYGNYLLSLSSQDYDKFIDLNTYLFSNRFASGMAAVYYLDICAFAEADTDLFEKIRQMERQLTIKQVDSEEAV
jgi:FkbM family methyltransferase